MIKVRHTTTKISNGHSLLMSQYTKMSKRAAKRLINRMHLKYKGSLLVKSPQSIAIPSQGIEIIRTGHNSLVICQVTGGVSDLTTRELMDRGFTHFWNEDYKIWVSFQEMMDELSQMGY